jgi:hypothetical protein
VDEAVHTIFLDELRAISGAMLLEPGSKVIGDADVERPLSAAGEDVDVVGAVGAHDRRENANI